MTLTVADHEVNDRLRNAMEQAHGFMFSNRGAPRPRLHVGPAVVAYMKGLCLTEDTTRPPASRFAGFDVIPEPNWEPHRIVLRVDWEIL